MGLSYWLVKYQEGQLRKCESLGFESSEHNFLGQSCMVKEDERERGMVGSRVDHWKLHCLMEGDVLCLSLKGYKDY